MDEPSVLQALNFYVPRKTAIALKNTCKTANEYITVKDFSKLIVQFDFSDVAKIEMIVNMDKMYDGIAEDSVWFPCEGLSEDYENFSYIMEYLKLFRGVGFVMDKRWTKEHYVVFLAYTAYYYSKNTYGKCGDYNYNMYMDYLKNSGIYKFFHHEIKAELKIISDKYLVGWKNYWETHPKIPGINRYTNSNKITGDEPNLTFMDFYSVINRYSIEKLKLV